MPVYRDIWDSCNFSVLQEYVGADARNNVAANLPIIKEKHLLK